MSLFPVIFPVPSPPRPISGRKKVLWIQEASREALRLCAYFSKVSLELLKKDSHGAPMPFAGTYWSVSHKPQFAAAVLGKYPIGIDIEEVKPRSEGVFKKAVSSDEEIFCEGKDKQNFFFRVWTAKEAVLKAEGVGLKGLSKCRVIEMPDETEMRLSYEEKTYKIIQVSIKGHIASVITNGEPVNWVLPPSL